MDTILAEAGLGLVGSVCRRESQPEPDTLTILARRAGDSLQAAREEGFVCDPRCRAALCAHQAGQALLLGDIFQTYRNGHRGMGALMACVTATGGGCPVAHTLHEAMNDLEQLARLSRLLRIRTASGRGDTLRGESTQKEWDTQDRTIKRTRT